MTTPQTVTKLTGQTRALAARVSALDTDANRARLRLWLTALRHAVWVSLVVVGRYLAVAAMMIRTDWRWRSWADESGVATWKTSYRTRWERDEDGHVHRKQETCRKLVGVPKIKRWRLHQHHATAVIKVPARHDLDSLSLAVTGPLRHQAGAQRASIREIKPGVAAIDLLRRDPLDHVLLRPHATGPDTFVVARDERGRARPIELGKVPHLLFMGATGAGKSSMVNTLAGAMAPTTDLMLMCDLKFGLEAVVLGDRWSSVITTSEQANKAFSTLLEQIVPARAALLRFLLCQNVAEAESRYGIRLRRIRLFIDEVAELGKDAQATLLRLVSLVRALGITVIVAGQRFGKDQGEKVTSIRSQLAGRVIGGVLDLETARMGLPGEDEDTLKRLLNLHRPGSCLVRMDAPACLWRFPEQGIAQLRPLGQAHADKALPLDALIGEDRAAVAHLSDEQVTASLMADCEKAGR